MDLSEYLPMFIAECREHLQELDLAVVALEDAPDDRERIDEIFRAAHSLKGMSATMGFSEMAALTHEMENVFELVRQGELDLGRELIDVVLACLDELSGAVDAIERDGAEAAGHAELIARLRKVASGASASAQDVGVTPAEPCAEPACPSDIEVPDGCRLLTVSVTLHDDVLMPAVRAYMVLTALAEHGELVRSSPTPDEVDDFDGLRIEAALVSELEDEPILATVGSIEGVSDVSLNAAGDGPRASAPAPARKTRRRSPVAKTGAAKKPRASSKPRAASASAAPKTVETPSPGEIPAPGETAAPGETPAPVAPDAPAQSVAPAAAPAAQPAAAARPAAARATTTVRVDAERLDQLMHYMGELVVQRTRLQALVSRDASPEVAQAMQDLTRCSQSLQALVMKVRMIEVEAVLVRMPRLVRDLSSKLGKQVELRLIGADTELDRTVVEQLGDPLVHLVRNSVDHGLEPPAAREAAGKPAVGTLEIAARNAGDSIVITVRDDGHGVDPQNVSRKAIERGLIPPGTELDGPQAVEMLFNAGFSTVEKATDVSGRGVGMDAVRSIVRGMGGDVTLQSQLGVGTTAEIRLPLTLAIVSALLVLVEGQPYAIPLDRVERTVRLADQAVREAAGMRLLVLGEAVLPVVEAAQHLGSGQSDSAATHAVIVRTGDQRIALAVERLVGQQELVTRALPPELASSRAVSGGAVLSNGEIALIVDCDALVAGGTARARTLARAA